MKKILKIENVLIAAGILLLIGFAIRLGADYYQMQIGLHSAPFYLFVLERSLTFLLPSMICFVVAVFMKRHSHTNEENR